MKVSEKINEEQAELMRKIKEELGRNIILDSDAVNELSEKIAAKAAEKTVHLLKLEKEKEEAEKVPIDDTLDRWRHSVDLWSLHKVQ